MSMANPLWGAPRIHGELLMLGIDVAQSTCGEIHGAEVSTATVTELEHLLAQPCSGIASIDLFVMPTRIFHTALWSGNPGS